MRTYQDLVAIENGTQNELIDFVYTCITNHKASDEYATAVVADNYARQQNETIVNYQKLLYTMSGEAVPDNYSANYKMCSNFFNRFTTQQVQYLLGNGVGWQNEDTDKKLGAEFDNTLQEIALESLIGGVAFGFWNYDHMECFNLREFVPLYDEEDGALKAGIRFWQIDEGKPLRATLYEMDGYTDYIWNRRQTKKGEEYQGTILYDKRAYQQVVRQSVVDGLQIFDKENYPNFPIVPLWANRQKQSEIIGLREEIDAYDLIKSGFANDIDDASQIYWTIQNAGGMDDVDLAKFIQHMRVVKASVVEDTGARAESHTMDVPYASREAILTRLRNDLYDDYMAFDPTQIASGSVTATQIRASYEPINNKADMFEFCVRTFIAGILDLVGVDDQPSFSRSAIINASEEIDTILSASQYLPARYVTEKILTLLGDKDRIDEVNSLMDEEDINRFTQGSDLA